MLRATCFVVDARESAGSGHIRRCKRIALEIDKSLSLPFLILLRDNYVKVLEPIYTSTGFDWIESEIPEHAELGIIVDSYNLIDHENAYNLGKIAWKGHLRIQEHPKSLTIIYFLMLN